MTNENLTCKLSDEREFELLAEHDWQGFVAADLDIKYLVVRPIKREPREWFSVLYDNGIGETLQTNSRFPTFVEAQTYIDDRDFRNPEIIKVREVI